MVNGIPNDWVYQVKKALNFKVYSNQAVMSDLVDILQEELEKMFGDRVISFKLDDLDRTFQFNIRNSSSEDENFNVTILYNTVMTRFFTDHMSLITDAIQSITGKKIYSDVFSDMLIYHQSSIFGLLSRVSAFVFPPESGVLNVTIRLF
jgi:hypothetical protein